MLQRTVVALLVLVSIGAPPLSAGFSPNKYVGGLVQMPTAYTTNRGEWQLGIGPVTYGITDHIEIGTDIGTFLFGGFMLGAKVNVFRETRRMPCAVGVSAGYLSKLFTVPFLNDSTDHGQYASAGVTLSRWLAFSDTTAKGRMGLHANCNYNYTLSEPESTLFKRAGFNLGVGFDVFITTHTRLIIEGLTNLGDFSPRGLIGVHWAWQNFNLKLGVGSTGGVRIPVYPTLGLFWRFGGPDPDGN